ncbi:TetR/AcrR family transcriptional regulator [Nocardia otitidiscaviarum]|uniref:Helix-turn-helix transcriptional regulator n=1 Tax=Nocardia otitidiscaviarum TaxID=1823 RepID=A0A516NMU7_9NOCA|nr:TetR/AcrR family transcriptional regulator [Nocardia otitidiscaviarum]MBF6181017.1 helix-turn-helix transcriptional regulator [Nocardia otitidiscaviarum]MCP9624536.1 TetR/AcrR family transcriptional regulator [Nocardia otitidiscaviarum]QDP80217.1 helix-turn-helix transcriptional regulator [Nocardia otitidiscaviarum]
MAVEQRKERADAARNRRAILDATRALLAEHGAEAVTMDRVAAAAGVGKGTIFHRFGSRAGLLYELLAEPAETLMAAIADGPPPLGPGAPAGERLLAFFDAMTVVMAENVELTAASAHMPPHPRVAEFHGTWDRHITALLREVRPDIDADSVARLLFSAVGSDVARAMVRNGETDRLRAAVRDMVTAVLRQP